MIVFVIPLMSKQCSHNWGGVVKNFNTTLRSIFRQTDSNFAVYVGCNEIPETYEEYGERLHFVVCDMPFIPATHEEKGADKSWKLINLLLEIKKHIFDNGPRSDVFVMPVDADDYINVNIANYVNTNPNAYGYVSEYGYVMRKGDSLLVKTEEIYSYCGSCNIINTTLDDLPNDLPEINTYYLNKELRTEYENKYPVLWPHNWLPQRSEAAGKPFSIIPFPTTIYCLGTGENLSNYDPNVPHMKRSIIYNKFVIYVFHLFRICFSNKDSYYFFGKQKKREFGIK